MRAPTPDEIALLPDIEIEYNLLTDLDSEDIRRIREAVEMEANRVIWDVDATWNADSSDGKTYPFDVPIIERKQEREPRIQAVIKQLQASLRYLDEMLALDSEISGLPSGVGIQDKGAELARSAGVRLPVRSVNQRGHSAVVITSNQWGSTDYNDPALQSELEQFLQGCKEPHAPYEEVLDQALKLQGEVDTSYDMQVLTEDDKVDIFTGGGEKIGTATVKEARGNFVLLHVNGKARVRSNCYLRKRSNAEALRAYKDYLYQYCRKLGIVNQMKDRHGDAYDWGFSTDDDGNVQQELTLPEQVFFGQEGNLAHRIDRQNEVRYFEFTPDDIPRGLLGDTEQSVAYGLGAMGHPCYLIQGPPGTGKTMVASRLVSYFQEQRLRTLVCSHSNRGLDVLLQAIKSQNCKVHRAGTEIGVCAKELRDDFIRKDLKPPEPHDFLVTKMQNPQAWKDACIAWNKSGRKPEDEPNRDDFLIEVVDEHELKMAWESFHRQKVKLIQELDRETSLTAGVTLNSLISDEIIQSLPFDVVIIDEASKGYMFEILPALLKAGMQVIFIGDHKQLSNVKLPKHLSNFLQNQPNGDGEDDSHVLTAGDIEAFENGPFEFFAEHTAIPQVMLRTNRRSYPGIVEMVSLARYGGKLKAGKFDENDPSNPGFMRWVDTASRQDRFERQIGVSKGNDLEARIIARRLARDYGLGLLPESLGVISMYSAQRRLILDKLCQHPFRLDYHRDLLLQDLQGNNGTVDSFQGSERQRIYLSMVSSNDRGTIGHTRDLDRAGVAISRPQEEFIMAGDSSTLIENNPFPESEEFYRTVRRIIAKHGEVITEFPSLPPGALREDEKSPNYNAQRNRRRRERRIARTAVEKQV